MLYMLLIFSFLAEASCASGDGFIDSCVGCENIVV